MEMEERGLIHVYCGDGKGKTSAATGLMVRAAGRGKRILFVRFLKNEDSGELVILDQIPQIRRLKIPKTFGFFWTLNEEEKEELKRICYGIWEQIEQEARRYDILVMDELASAFRYGLVPQDKVLRFLKSKPSSLEVVMTGREPDERILQYADYISEIQSVRHPFEKGIPAREGIEY
nr:cob(I)yrinic acid a,c-diamide adenosyltransferase [uncultured Sellimonas sp.]